MSFFRACSVMVLSIALLSPSVSLASPEGECASSKHKPISEIKVPWGTPYEQAYTMLSSQYRAKARVTKESETEIKVNFNRSNRNLFDFMAYKFTAGRLTFVGISYSDNFQRRMGGIADAWKLLGKKLIERYSEKADSVDTPSRDTLIAKWNSQPVHTELYGKDPNLLYLKTQCTPLREKLETKVRATVDVGF